MEGMAILVVDRQARFFKALSEYLEQHGNDWELLYESTAERGAERIAEGRVALALSPPDLRPAGAPLRCKYVQLLEQAPGAPLGAYLLREASPAQHVAALRGWMKESTQVLGVTSPCGGAGKTSVAWGLCCAAARAGKRVCYLSLEDVMGDNPFAKVQRVSFDEVIAQLDDEAALYETLPQTLCSSDNARVDTFAPGERMIDREEMSGGDVDRLLSVLAHLCRWDYLVVDMASSLDARMMQVWAHARRMLVVMAHVENAAGKKQTMQRELDFRARRGELTLDKLAPVLNRVQGSRELGFEDTHFGTAQAVYALPLVRDSDAADADAWFGCVRDRMAASFDELLGVIG